MKKKTSYYNLVFRNRGESIISFWPGRFAEKAESPKRHR